MRIYVAYRTDSDPEVHGQRKTSGSMTTLKSRLREVPESSWSLFLYDITPNVKILCDLIENPWAIVTMDPKEGPSAIRVNEQGQIRKV